MEQEEFLEKRYREYRELMYKKKRSAFKNFWTNLKEDWKEAFGWSAADDEDAARVPSLEKVSEELKEGKSKTDRDNTAI